MLRHSIDESALPRRSLLAVAPTKEDAEDPNLLSTSSNNPFTQTDSSSIDLEAERIDQQKADADNEDDKRETASETSSSYNSVIDGPTANMDSEIAMSFTKEADRRMTVATAVSSVDGDEDVDVEVEEEEAQNKLDVQLLHDIADNMIGRNVPFETPFGTKAQCYADYTASGKAIESIETFIRNEVMPTYGNTHTTTSVTGLQTTSFREEARQIIGKAVNARLHGSGARDVVVFAGQGCTSAINKFITALGLTTMRRHHRPNKRPVIFTCPFSHHSNLLPWREMYAADVVEIPEAKAGGLDLKELERQLQSYQSRELKIGTFAAASNLTGMLADVDKVSKLLHKYGALSCWDYATCAPYVEIDMNPKNDPAAYKDAVFFSGHKFVGGPGSPGVLVVKKNLMTNEVPTMPGGGTVLFVTEKAHSYLANKVEREEGGTPDILGSIRLGLAFELKQRLGPKNIMQLERQHVRHVREALGHNDHIVLLGHEDVDQLPVFSFLVRFGDRFLHHNFVCALLNDLFGIQARGGCQCAGPFGARLLGLSREHITALGYAVVAKDEVLKPGVSRMSFPYFADEKEVDYILEAVNFVATHGWKFLPQYEYDPHNGAWRHVSRATAPFPAKKFLANMQLDDVETVRASVCAAPIRSIAAHRRENLEQAAVLADQCIAEAASAEEFPEGQKLVQSHEWLRWFAYPHEAVTAYKEHGEKPALTKKIEGPCQPQRYLDGTVHKVWEGVPSLGKMKRSLMGRFVLKVFMQAELEAMKDKRTDEEKSVLNEEQAMCAVFGGAEKCQ
jgi:selenocysteine lyase/cysteine desulfurase